MISGLSQLADCGLDQDFDALMFGPYQASFESLETIFCRFDREGKILPLEGVADSSEGRHGELLSHKLQLGPMGQVKYNITHPGYNVAILPHCCKYATPLLRVIRHYTSPKFMFLLAI